MARQALRNGGGAGTVASGKPARLSSVGKALSLLKLVATRYPDGATLSQVARASGIPTATTYRLLNLLVGEDFLTFDPYAKNYHVGLGIAAIAEAARLHTPDVALRSSLRPALEDIARATEDSVYLSIRSGRDALCIDRVPGSYPVSANTLEIGARRPLGIGAGSLALLSALPEEEREETIRLNAPRYAQYAGITAEEMLSFAAETAQRGYAFNDARIITEVRAVAITLPDRRGTHSIAISLAAVSSRLRKARREEVLQILRDARARARVV